MAATLQHIVPVRRQHPLGKLIRFAVRLANHPPLELMAVCQPPPYACHGSLERALSKARKVEASAPKQVRVAKIQLWLPILLPAAPGQSSVAILGRVGAHVALLREKQVGDQLDVVGPVARVVEDEHGVDLERVLQVHAGSGREDGLGQRARGRGVYGVEERVEGEDLRVGLDDIGRRNDVAEAVSLGDQPAFFSVGARHEDGLFPQAVRPSDKLAEGRVRLDKVVSRELDAKLLAKVFYPFGLVLAAAVGEEDERDVVFVQELEGFGGAGNGRRDVEEDAINAAVCEVRDWLNHEVGDVMK